MSNDNEITDLDEHWEEEAEDTHTETGTAVNRTKPVENKDARRRLDDLLESQRIKREIDDDLFED